MASTSQNTTTCNHHGASAPPPPKLLSALEVARGEKTLLSKVTWTAEKTDMNYNLLTTMNVQYIEMLFSFGFIKGTRLNQTETQPSQVKTEPNTKRTEIDPKQTNYDEKWYHESGKHGIFPKKIGKIIVDDDEEDEDWGEFEVEDEDEGEFLPMEKMKNWLEKKPRGAGFSFFTTTNALSLNHLRTNSSEFRNGDVWQHRDSFLLHQNRSEI
ncbi:hypothetical protein YC2023_016487 [Brassica napus]